MTLKALAISNITLKSELLIVRASQPTTPVFTSSVNGSSSSCPGQKPCHHPLLLFHLTSSLSVNPITFTRIWLITSRKPSCHCFVQTIQHISLTSSLQLSLLTLIQPHGPPWHFPKKPVMSLPWAICCWHPSRSMSGSFSHFLLVFTQKSTFEWDLLLSPYLKVSTIPLLICHILFPCFIFFLLCITSILYTIVIYVYFLFTPIEYKPH